MPLLEAGRSYGRVAAGKPLLDRVSLTVRAGEIVGIAGVAGNGQSELVEALIGARTPDGGRVGSRGRDVTVSGVTVHRAAGSRLHPRGSRLGRHCAARRARPTISPWASIAALRSLGGALIDRSAMAERRGRLIARFASGSQMRRVPVGTLSGGNLQKVVVARELSHAAPVLIAEQPTRGVDVGAIEFIHEPARRRAR